MNIIHLFNKSNSKGGITIAYRRVHNIVVLSFATCSVKDRYCKSIGRELAINNLKSRKNFYVIPVRDLLIKYFSCVQPRENFLYRFNVLIQKAIILYVYAYLNRGKRYFYHIRHALCYTFDEIMFVSKNWNEVIESCPRLEEYKYEIQER